MIGVSGVLHALRAVVAEAGADYVYERNVTRCTYVFNGQPDCLAAKVLVRLGVPLDVLAPNEGKSVERIYELTKFVTRDALYVLRAAQIVQDAGQPWGSALVAAELEAKT